MKRMLAVLALAVSPLVVANDDPISNIVKMAQAAGNSGGAAGLVNSMLPAGMPSLPMGNGAGAVYQGGKLVSGNPQMALVCTEFQEPNACVTKTGALPFYKYIIVSTGETSFTIDRIDVNTFSTGKSSSVTIYFTPNP